MYIVLMQIRFARKWTNPYNIFKVKRICFIRNSKLINNNDKIYFFIINNIINIDDKKNKNILKNQC